MVNDHMRVEMFLAWDGKDIMKFSAGILFRWIGFLAALGALFYLWMFGLIVVALDAPLSMGLIPFAWTLFVLGLAVLALRLVLRKNGVVFVGLAMMMLLPIIYGGVSFHLWWTKDRFATMDTNMPVWQYIPFEKDNLLVEATCPAELRFEGANPRIDCAYALYPIGAAAVQAQCDPENFQWWIFRATGSPQAYDNLLDTWVEADVILALAPSAKQEKQAEELGKILEMTPISKDAFVFFVPVTNPIDGLTSAQIRSIYSGEINSWRELGVDLDATLRPYQRNEGSGSQTALQRMMGDTPIRKPIEEDKKRSMGEIVREAADYRNHPGAIGFSFRYYTKELLREGQIKLLSIDGVEPTIENIRSGAYPFVETAYAITAKPREGNTEKFIAFLTSPEGRALIESTGYVTP